MCNAVAGEKKSTKRLVSERKVLGEHGRGGACACPPRAPSPQLLAHSFYALSNKHQKSGAIIASQGSPWGSRKESVGDAREQGEHSRLVAGPPCVVLEGIRLARLASRLPPMLF